MPSSDRKSVDVVGDDNPVAKAEPISETAASEVGARWKDAFVNASALEFLTFSWATVFIREAFTREVDRDEVWNLRTSESCDHTFHKFLVEWERELRLPAGQRKLR
jgi:hypothetical protein